MDRTVSGQIVHIGIHIAERDAADQIQIHVINGDLIKRRVLGYAAFVQLEKSEKAAQVQKIFVHGGPGVALNGLVINKKIT